MIYDIPTDRKIGDIDIFVDFKDHNKAIHLLNNLGYQADPDTQQNYRHHTEFIKGKIFVELHRNIINPETGIDEKYLKEHTAKCKMDNFTVRTFDITATLLHLFYHLYMDTFRAYKSFASLFETGTLPKANRFSYRAYEISIFIKKYTAHIKWNDIINDLKKQPLRIFFKQMIYDIDKIYSGVLPECFLKAVKELEYVYNITDELVYKPFIDSENSINEKSTNKILCNYITKMKRYFIVKNDSLNIGESILLKSSVENSRLSCKLTTQMHNKGIEFTFDVTDIELVLSDANTYNTASSDGIHLILYSSEVYAYKSIFLFPKKEKSGNIKVYACDVLTKPYIIDDSLITRSFDLTHHGYIIKTVLSIMFLEQNNISDFVYLNFMISDCDPLTHIRKETLLPINDIANWYDPSYFIKFNIK